MAAAKKKEQAAKAKAERAKHEAQAAAIYAAYPRKVARSDAIDSIIKAGKVHGFDVLLAKTQAYAEAVGRWPKSELQFVPYPATWFNQERFLDDPATWERRAPAAPAWRQVLVLDARIKRHPANPQWIGHDPRAVTPELKAELVRLRAEHQRLSEAVTSGSA